MPAERMLRLGVTQRSTTMNGKLWPSVTMPSVYGLGASQCIACCPAAQPPIPTGVRLPMVDGR